MRALFVLIVPVVIAAAVSSSSAIADVATETRNISEFHAVHITGGVELTVRRGEAPSLVISGKREDIAALRTEVKDGVLVIEPSDVRVGARRRVGIAVTTPRLDSVKASGGVRVTVESGAGRTLAVRASGGVVFSAKGLELEGLELDASGGALLELSGRAAELRAELSGGVDLDARHLSADRVALDASGGCTASVNAKESLSGSASGGVNVEVRGRPRKALVKTSGGSGVEYLD